MSSRRIRAYWGKAQTTLKLIGFLNSVVSLDLFSSFYNKFISKGLRNLDVLVLSHKELGNRALFFGTHRKKVQTALMGFMEGGFEALWRRSSDTLSIIITRMSWTGVILFDKAF